MQANLFKNVVNIRVILNARRELLNTAKLSDTHTVYMYMYVSVHNSRVVLIVIVRRYGDIYVVGDLGSYITSKRWHCTC